MLLRQDRRRAWWGIAAVVSAVSAGLLVPPSAPAVAAEKRVETRVLGWWAPVTTVTAGSSFTDTVRVRPKLPRRSFRVEWLRDSGAWRTAQRGRTTRQGLLRVRRDRLAVGRHAIRIRIQRTAGTRATRVGVRRIRVLPKPPRPVVTPPPTPVPSPSAPPPTPTPTPAPSPSLTPPRQLLPAVAPGTSFRAYAVGDIGYCRNLPDPGDPPAADTAALIPAGATLFAAGDLAYPDGTAADFADCYLPWYARLLPGTVPVPGNHEYRDPALAYFDVFGAAVGTRAEPWYAVQQGDWTFYLLNSNCDDVGGCGPDSAQYRWLQAQLANDPHRCIAAMWHHPRWSSSYHGPYERVSDLYALLGSAGADLLLAGHEHSYQRFARLDVNAVASPTGIRQIVVGTGGAALRPVNGADVPAAEVADATNYGVLQLDFGPAGFSWEFLPVPDPGSGAVLTGDTGSETC